jgi:hypothetical protein
VGLDDLEDEEAVAIDQLRVGEFALEVGEALGDERGADLGGLDGGEAECVELVGARPWVLPTPMTASIRSAVGMLITHSLLRRMSEKLWFWSQM